MKLANVDGNSVATAAATAESRVIAYLGLTCTKLDEGKKKLAPMKK